MKNKNRFKLFILILLIPLFISGCFKRDELEDIEILTTIYPLEYITNRLYGEHALVNSIYPDDTNPEEYTFSEKQMNDFSKKELFVYNGLSDDKDIAISFLDRNKNMLIIDSAFGMELTYGVEELWLNPSHLLMMTQNIRNGLKEYISNSYLKKEIDKQYETLKVDLSELDAEIKLTAENATNKTLVVSNNVLKYLENYGFNIISLDESSGVPNERTINDVKTLIQNDQVKHIFILENDEINNTIQQIIDSTSVETQVFRKVDNITDQERDNKEDYLSIMNQNIDAIKAELY